MSDGTTGTIGTTSAAPIRGCTPSCRCRSIRSRAQAIAASSASTTSVPSPTSVYTERWWSWSLWMSSSRARSAITCPSSPMTTGSRPSEKFGTASRGSSALGDTCTFFADLRRHEAETHAHEEGLAADAEAEGRFERGEDRKDAEQHRCREMLVEAEPEHGGGEREH